ncbi:prolyl oligopeptidase family serine peptidase [Thalassotalea sp. 1_MG-2023]|uniref:alpha/beta hydrolase family protein n=1 Tax=Thalassotalea sp. 1_MG-2023 TaxID=3062680 RepID=UPI0026E38499|nr:alpha/beta fold hydrolase [Thalassotalea sp. 1_MG-2023]MDO6427266.1 prolyl oligopeptidase family serine peptidase [Thalassotalea sp. 1_MG-2023]
MFLFLFVISFKIFAFQGEYLFDNPTYTDVQLSPDGKIMAVKAEVKGKFVIIFIDNKQNKPVNIVSLAGNQEVGNFGWVNNERVVMTINYRKPWVKELSSYGELFAINFDGSQSEMIYGYQSGEQQVGSNIRKKKSIRGWASIVDMLPEDKEHILISSTPWSASRDKLSTVYKLNTYSGKLVKKIAKAPISYASFVTDVTGEVVIATGTDEDNKQQVFIRRGEKWQKLSQSGFGKSFIPLTVTKSGKELYVLDRYKQDKTGLFTFNLEDLSFKHIYTDKNVDITNVSRTIDKRKIYAIRVDDGRPAYILIEQDLDEARVFRLLTQSFPGKKLDITSHTEDGSKYVVRVSSDTDPGAFYLFDSNTNRLALIFKYYPKIDQQKLQVMEPIIFTSSDDYKIHGFFTSAVGGNETNPLIIMVHGGPHARDYWGFSSQTQYLALNGFSVLQVNFRGSTGYGEEFKVAGYEQWGGNIQRDIYESYLWALKNNKVEGNNVCIMGASFGGYSAIQSAVKYPDVYRCSVANAGVYDLPLLFNEGDVKDLSFGESYLSTTLGTDEAKMKLFSPNHHVDKIKAALFLAHGEKDVRAPYEHVVLLRKSLDKINKPYEWFVLEKETHGFHDPINQTAYMKKVVQFLKEHLDMN